MDINIPFMRSKPTLGCLLFSKKRTVITSPVSNMINRHGTRLITFHALEIEAWLSYPAKVYHPTVTTCIYDKPCATKQQLQKQVTL